MSCPHVCEWGTMPHVLFEIFEAVCAGFIDQVIEPFGVHSKHKVMPTIKPAIYKTCGQPTHLWVVLGERHD